MRLVRSIWKLASEWMRDCDRNWDRGPGERSGVTSSTAMNASCARPQLLTAGLLPILILTIASRSHFEKSEGCSHKFIGHINPHGEVVEIPMSVQRADLRLFPFAPVSAPIAAGC